MRIPSKVSIKKYFSYFFGYGLLAMIAIGMLIGYYKGRILKNRGVIEQAYIYKKEQTSRSFVVYYSFQYEGNQFLGKYSFSYWKKRGKRLSYKYYPVIFDPENPLNSFLLFFDENFERFGFVTPDSIANR